ncbi:MAG: ribosome maturation factor RimP [Pseudomonadales bacterium]|nr:ribosome maturation factor RimP [Pseudomonadales bacterium]MDG2079075.1 ribosome maturation factor RimP [Pseudomonadales bacterium]
MALVDRLQDIVRPVVEDIGLDFWGLQYQSGSVNAVLRIYIDSPSGINVDDCAKVSRQLSVLLDAEDIIQSGYRLEVSSPGMSRPFFDLPQYASFIGSTVRVKLAMPYEGRRQIKGVINQVDVDSRELAIVEGETEYVLPYELIEKGQLLPEFE